MYFSKEVIKKIESTIGFFKPECGGIIAKNQNNIISDFYYDNDAGFGKASYVPSRIPIQNHVRENWNLPNLQFCGIVHSHPLCNKCEPSYIDIKMASKIMAINNMNEFYLFMVMGREMKLYCVTCDNNQEQYLCKKEKIEI